MICNSYFCRTLLTSLCLLGVSACGTLKNASPDANPAARAPQSESAPDNDHDPLQGFNRAMYTFNDKLDKYALKPLAKGYRAITPSAVRKGVSNFFSNLHEPTVMLNNLIQGKPKQASSDLGRFLVNTTVGLAGLIDVSSKIGLQKHDEDFGQTLAVWGVGDGPYLVLPLFGPSNLRDGPALIVDVATYPPNYLEDSGTKDKLLLLEITGRRSQLLDASDILDQAAGQDPYVFIREAMRQRRRNLIYDGNPPQPPPDPSLFEDDSPTPPAKKK